MREEQLSRGPAPTRSRRASAHRGRWRVTGTAHPARSDSVYDSASLDSTPGPASPPHCSNSLPACDRGSRAQAWARTYRCRRLERAFANGWPLTPPNQRMHGSHPKPRCWSDRVNTVCEPRFSYYCERMPDYLQSTAGLVARDGCIGISSMTSSDPRKPSTPRTELWRSFARSRPATCRADSHRLRRGTFNTGQ